MFDSMYEVKKDKAIGLFCVRPIANKSEPYIIVFDNETTAKQFCVQLTMKQVQSPIENPALYKSKGVHPDGKTQLLSPR